MIRRNTFAGFPGLRTVIKKNQIDPIRSHGNRFRSEPSQGREGIRARRSGPDKSGIQKKGFPANTGAACIIRNTIMKSGTWSKKKQSVPNGRIPASAYSCRTL
jgi:hypothetical protein